MKRPFLICFAKDFISVHSSQIVARFFPVLAGKEGSVMSSARLLKYSANIPECSYLGRALNHEQVINNLKLNDAF